MEQETIFEKGVLTMNNKWKSSKMLKQYLKEIKEFIVSYRLGISACPNIVGLKCTGFDNVKLYHDGFSDWIPYGENEVIQDVE